MFGEVKIWFQNRRMKWRNSKERELLASGGSREQTLPTKNNPNPDLSDVVDEARCKTAAKDDLNNHSGPGDDHHHLSLSPHKDQQHFQGPLPPKPPPQPPQGRDFVSTLAATLPGKIQIKDLSALSNYSKHTPYAFPSYAEGEADYSDEDINVTDDLVVSNNEDSDND
ncbi:Homeodomain [Halocaridina rubra]|uniref:Homeodomain n=1 Tax=Halocaridina rubra TaxID=373956 RepID=A0AAN9AFE4_HALRR